MTEISSCGVLFLHIIDSVPDSDLSEKEKKISFPVASLQETNL